MKGYSKYKVCDISWIDEIPEHWDIRKMKYTFTERSEKNHPDEQILCATQSQGVIPQAMYDNRVVVVNKGFENLKFVKKGDFVISLRSFQGGIEYAYYQGIISAAYTILNPNKIIDSEFAKYLLKSHQFIELLKTCVTGIREGQNINYDILRKKFLPIPPLSEQQHIVSFLDEKTAKIDEYIDKKNKEIEALKEWKKALIAHVVTKGLNANAKMKKFKSLLSDETPSHWKIVRNKNIFESHYEAVSSRKNIPLLSLTTEGVILRDISTGKGKFPKDFEMYNVVYPNNIIFCLFDLDETPRTVGLCYNYGMITNAYTIFKIKNTVLPEYITNYYLAVDNIKALRPYYSGLRKVVQSNRFNSIQIPLPPIEEQQEIVEYIEAATTKANKMIVELTNHVERMKEYKQRLIADVVTGKINVQP